MDEKPILKQGKQQSESYFCYEDILEIYLTKPHLFLLRSINVYASISHH